MVTQSYINTIIAQAQRAAADYAYRISRQSLTGENPDALWEKLNICIDGATNLTNNYGLTDRENQTIIDKLLTRGGIGNYGNTAITFTPITVITPTGAFTNLSGMVTSVGMVTTVVTNANLTGPITSVGNATSIASQTGTGTTFVMRASPNFTGTPTAPTASAGTSTTQLATTAFVTSTIGSYVPYSGATGNVNLNINLDGSNGYSAAFLKEAFGGLAKLGYTPTQINSSMVINSKDANLVKEIGRHIDTAKKS